MWRGVNDDLRHADALSRLLRGLDCRINLIRYHSLPGSPLRTASGSGDDGFPRQAQRSGPDGHDQGIARRGYPGSMRHAGRGEPAG